MLDIKFIRENIDLVKENNKNRKVNIDVDRLLKLDEERRDLQKQADDLRAERKAGSKGKPSQNEMERMKKVGEEVKKLENELSKIELEYLILLGDIPNLTHPAAPIGDEEDFIVLEEMGDELKFNFEPKDHEELMTNKDIVDFERGAKVAGSKFYYTKGDGVLLNQALLNYGLEVVVKHGFVPMETPDLVKEEIIDASGFNPRGEESQIYKIENHDLSLIGTAEISLLGLHAGETLDLSNGPIKYAGISKCYRTEGGAYGKANKGMYRVHQFTKLEMFVYCKREESESLHEDLKNIEKEICDGLGLSYRIIDTPTGDLGGPAYRKFDFEARMTMKDFGEITSASNCTDYQARRLNIKYKNDEGKNELVHTLNGTAMVLSRFPLAIFEQFQNEDGTVNIPEVLQKYMGKKKIS